MSSHVCAEAYRPFEVYHKMWLEEKTIKSNFATKIDIWCVGLIIYQLCCLMERSFDGNKDSCYMDFCVKPKDCGEEEYSALSKKRKAGMLFKREPKFS